MRQREWAAKVQREHRYAIDSTMGAVNLIVCSCGESFPGFVFWSRHLMALEADESLYVGVPLSVADQETTSRDKIGEEK